MLEIEQKLVLRRINEIRKDAGLGRINKLKRGVPKHNRACTLAMSLAGTRYRLGTDMIDYEDEDVANCANEIIHAFDEGEMPELELPKTPVKIRYPGDRKATVVE